MEKDEDILYNFPICEALACLSVLRYFTLGNPIVQGKVFLSLNYSPVCAENVIENNN